NLDGELACGDHYEQRHEDQRRTAPALEPRECDRDGDQQRGTCRDRAEVSGRRARKEQTTHALSGVGTPRDAALELPPACANEVIADVRGAVVWHPRVRLPCALDAL